MQYYTTSLLLILILELGNAQLPHCILYDTTLCYLEEKKSDIKFDIKQKFISKDDVMVYQTPLLIDIDNDCIPEIVAASDEGYEIEPVRLTKNILIIDSGTGETKKIIETAYFNWSTACSYVLGDVDSDGKVEFILVAVDNHRNSHMISGKLICYDMEGKIKWISDQKYGNNLSLGYGGTPSLADFNQDGVSEVYIYNEIFNARTGVKLADGGTFGKGTRTAYTSSGTNSVSIAGYFDDDNSDLELAAGYTIYKVDIINLGGMAGNNMTPLSIRLNGRYLDGLTSMADINLDGKMDVIVSSDGDFPDSKIFMFIPCSIIDPL